MNHPARYLPRLSLFLVAATLPLTSCSKEPGAAGKPPAFQVAERQTVTVDENIGRLVPEGAVVFAHIGNLSGFETKVKDVVKSFQPGAESMVGFDMMYTMWQLKERDLDLSRAGGMALKMGGQMGAEPILILPAKSAKDLVDVSGTPAVASGDYVGLGQGSEPSVAETASPLGSELPQGDIAVRVRLDQVLAPIRPKIDSFLEMLAQMPEASQDPMSKAGMEFMANWVKKLLDQAKTLEASVSLNEGKLDLGFVFKVAQGGALDAGPAKTDRNLPYLAASLPMPDASMVYMISGAAQMQAAFDPMYQAMAKDMPDKEAQQFLAAMRKSQEFYENMEDDMVMAMDFTPKGMQAVALMRAKDPKTFKQNWDGFMGDYSNAMNAIDMFGAQGMSFSKNDPVDISGVEFKPFTMKFDFAKMMEAQGKPMPEEKLEEMAGFLDAMFGKDGLTFAAGLDGNNVIVLMGNINELGTKTVASLRQNKRHKLTTLEATAGRLHMNPAFLFAVDVRRMFRSILEILPAKIREQAPPVPQGAPIPVWFASAANGPTYELQVHVDLAGIAGMVKEMSPRKR